MLDGDVLTPRFAVRCVPLDACRVRDDILLEASVALTSKQRAYLRGLAHHLNPSAMVGAAGVTGPVLKKVMFELEQHELIKVKFVEAPVAAKEAAEALATSATAELVQRVGHVVVLYKRRAKEPEIELPKA